MSRPRECQGCAPGPAHRTARPRLFVSAAVGAAVTGILALAGWRAATRLLVGWDVGVALYLALVAHMMWGADVARIRRRATDEDEGRLGVLSFVFTVNLAAGAL